MYRLSREKRRQVLFMLVEGMSMSAISRITGVAMDTITNLLIAAGEACLDHHHEHVVNLRRTKRVQVDEAWAFIYAKEKHVPFLSPKAPPEAGNVWTWTALDADNKLFISWVVGPRDSISANMLTRDLAYRVPGRVQLSSDGFLAYLAAVEEAFGGGGVDFAQVVKIYGSGTEPEHERRYSTATCRGVKKTPILGDPVDAHISTSYVERSNLSLRMGVRRYTRLTNAFSKRLVNHAHATSLWLTYYNWVRIHETLEITPAMAAGLTVELYDMDWLLGLVEAQDSQPGPRGPYKMEGRKKRSDAGIKRK